jgi:hypothetical protein
MNLQGHCRLRSRKLSQSVNNSINKICELYISSDLIIYLSAGDHTKLYKYVEEKFGLGFGSVRPLKLTN